MSIDPSRLDSLEQTIGRLASELAEARRSLAALRAESPAAALPPAEPARAPLPPHPAAGRSAPREDGGLEQLVGRYGVLVLAVLTIVMGAGALVSWAISRGLLGPWVRVTLGALLSLVIAAAGWWLRARDSRRFGNVLLALALAVLHVDAWGAGPRLGLVPAWVALALVDLSSVLLAALALAENEELMFSVGLLGTLIGPFVMETGPPQLAMLAAYGVIVLAAAVRTIGGHAWWRAIGLVLIGTALYTVRVNGYRGVAPWLTRDFGALFAAVVSVIALVWERKPSRPWIAVVALMTMALALTSHHTGRVAGAPLAALIAEPDIHLLAFCGTGLLLLAVRSFESGDQASAWTLAIILVPVTFLEASLEGVGPVRGPVSGSLVLMWAFAYVMASLAERGTRRGALIAASGVASLWAITLLLDAVPDAVPPVLAVHALLFAATAGRERQPLALIPFGLSVLVAFGMSAEHLASRPGFTLGPFLSVASLGAACAVTAAFLGARLGLPDRVLLSTEEYGREALSLLIVAPIAFAWGHLELRRAFSADASTFLLIAYYASCGVLAIHQGRVRRAGALRQVGLSLAVLAAGYAIVQASSVEQIALRVGSFLLAGAFLLGVAWWYRVEAEPAAAPGNEI